MKRRIFGVIIVHAAPTDYCDSPMGEVIENIPDC
jgi:hypothetical protein